MGRIIIAHRGNIDGPLKAEENKPKYIDAALENGFDVEVDLWLENGHFLLGHDSGQFQINDDFQAASGNQSAGARSPLYEPALRS